MGQSLTPWGSACLACSGHGRMLLWAAPGVTLTQLGLPLVHSLLLFVDEADAFLRKRATVSVTKPLATMGRATVSVTKPLATMGRATVSVTKPLSGHNGASHRECH